ncbi:MAG TPA: thioredoxin family protein [Flavisolibacter sp.]|nr:thioredoxin family protein [Flavisolibacter sp.]
MKAFPFLSLLFFLHLPVVWQTDFDQALQKAKTEHKYVLLSFSGSDWCIPCIKLHKEIFDSEAFTAFADDHLELVNADFPRLKKNQLPKDQQKKNEQLADQYDPQGSFPYTVLLNEEGKVVKAWEGYPNVSPEDFTGQLKTLVDAKP